MATFSEVNKVRLSLKMKLSQYWWYSSSSVAMEPEGFSILISVKKIDNQVRRLVPPLINGVSIRTNVE